MKKLQEEDLQTIANLTTEFLKIDRVEIDIRDIRNGYFKKYYNFAIIPRWIFSKVDTYIAYYVIHEICHQFGYRHNAYFKEMERKALGYWGIEIEYMRAYPKRLYENGEMVYESWRIKQRR